MKKIVLITITILSFLEAAYGENAVIADKKKDIIFCNSYVDVLEDPGRNLEFKDVLDSGNFTRKNSLNLGLTASQYWMKFTIAVPADNTEKLVIVIPNTKLDICEIFLPEKGAYRSVIFGEDLPYNHSSRDFHLFSVDFSSSPGEHTIYLRANNEDWFVLPVFLFTKSNYERFRNKTNLLDGLLFGVLIIMFLYYSFLGISTKDKTSIFFSVYILIQVSFEFLTSGHFQEYFLPNGILPDYVHYTIQLCGAGFFLFFFRSYVFSDQERQPLFVKAIMPAGLLALFLSLISPFVPITFAVLSNSIMAITLALIVIFIGIYACVKKNRQAYFLMAALLVTAMGTIIYNSLWAGWLPFNTLTLRSYLVGFIFMLAILAFGMADKVNMISRENIRLARLEKEYEGLKYRVLQERINPHFLFNALATLHSIMKKDIGLAEKAVISLSKIYRFLTDSATKELITIDEELLFVSSYLEFEKISYISDLSVEIIREGSFSEIMIPPLIVQSFVRNAIKHGLEKHGGKEHVTVIAKNKNDIISFEILDNGPGLETDDIYSRSIGNITDLLKYHYKTAHIIVENRNEGGVRAYIEISLNNDK